MSYRRNAKTLKPMFKCLEEMLGEHDAGLLLAIICDLLQDCCKGVEQRELRTLTLTINDYFTSKYDFEKDEIIESN